MKKTKARSSSRQNLALNLQLARTITGTSQEQLGLMCGLKRTYIGALERTEVNPGIDNLDRIAAGLGLQGHSLLLDPADAYQVLHVVLTQRGARVPLPPGSERDTAAVPKQVSGGHSGHVVELIRANALRRKQ